MQDLTEYGENELSMVIMNDEGLYNMRHVITKEFLNDIGLKFNEEQWHEFQDDLENEED